MTAFTMTGEHLARTLETARQRERQKIATLLDDLADVALAEGQLDAAGRLQGAAETVRSGGGQPFRTPTAPPPSTDPLLRDLDEEVAEGEAAVRSSLPPVHHLDDYAEGVAMVRNLGARGRLNLPRD